MAMVTFDSEIARSLGWSLTLCTLRSRMRHPFKWQNGHLSFTTRLERALSTGVLALMIRRRFCWDFVDVFGSCTYLGVWWDIAMHQQRPTLFKSNKCLISQRFIRRAKCICHAKCIQLSWTPLPTFRKAGSRKPAKRCLPPAACAKAACTLAVDSWLWAR